MNNDSDKHLDARLDAVLRNLPDKPVSSNFTARVMQEIEREAAKPTHSRVTRWNLWLHKFLPRVAVAAVLVSAGIFSVHTWQVRQRIDLAESLATVTRVDPIANPETLLDFEAIRRMGQQSSADEEVLALMQ